MKKLFVLLLSVMLLIFCAGCVTLTPPIQTEQPGSTQGGSSGGTQQGGTDPGEVGDGSEESEARKRVFTVSVTLDGAIYPAPDTISAVWTGENEVHTAKFGQDGNLNNVASVTGLDGKYTVSLTGLPDNYTYDPNGNYNVSNGNRDTKIELRTVTVITGTQGDLTSDKLPQTGSVSTYWENAISLGDTDAYYRITLKSEDHYKGFMFTPSRKGKYRVESYVDCKNDEINPILEVYSGANAIYYRGTYNTGGKSGKYTKNFRYEPNKSMDNEQVNEGYAIHVIAKTDFPVTVDFSVTYVGVPDGEYKAVVPKGEFVDTTEEKLQLSREMTQFGSAQHPIYDTDASGNKVLDAGKVKFNQQDGFYHLWIQNPDGSDNWGPTLYWFYNSSHMSSTMAMWSSAANVYKDYSTFLAKYQSLMQDPSLHGGHPVNEEIRTFLTDYARVYDLFNDGLGSLEDEKYVASGSDDVWLYDCGYFGTWPTA